MAQVVDTRGKTKATPSGKIMNGSKNNNSVSRGVAEALNDVGNSVVNAISDISIDEPRSTSSAQSARKRNSSPYTGISGGTPTTRSAPQSSWSPMYASLSNGKNINSAPRKSYWDSVQEENQKLANSIDAHFKGTDEQKTEESSELMPEMKIESASDSGYEYTPGEGAVNRWGEEYLDDPVGPVSTAWIGATRNNDRYEDLFATGFNGETESMPPYELDTTHNRDTAYDDTSSNKDWTSIRFDTTTTTPIISNVVDDGTMDYEHLTSTKVLGSQLKRYARNGMAPGMSADQIEQIDPDEVYDKAILAADPNVNFIPYIPDGRTYVDFAVTQPFDVTSHYMSQLGNARGEISSAFNPYQINWNNGDQSQKLNGPKFDEGVYGYLSSVYRDRWDNPQRFFDDTHDNGGHWTQYASQWQVPSPDGGVEYHYGTVTTPYVSNNDGTSNLIFDDGSSVQINDSWLESLFDEESNNYIIPSDSDGSWLIETPDGSIQSMSGDIVDLVTNMDGTSTVGFSDGTTATLDDSYIDSLERNDEGWPMMEFNGLTDVTGLGLDTSQLNETDFPDRYVDEETGEVFDQLNSPDVSSYWMPDYVMSDGTVLPYFDALAIAGDTNGREGNKNLKDNQSISYDFGSMLPFMPPLPFGLTITNTPARLQPEPLNIEEGKIDVSQLLKNGADRWFDWTTGSLPIMLPFTQWPASISNAMQDFRGASSGGYNPYNGGRTYIGAVRDDDGSLRYDPENDPNSSGNPLLDPRVTSGMMAGSVPVTEDLVGPIGDAGSGGRFLEKYFDGPGWKNALGRWILDWNSEGWEEVGGNIPEELQRYGLPGAFGNYLDENGNVVATESEAAKDENGKPIKQQWSPLPDRLYNAGIPMVRDDKLQVNPEALVNNVNAYIGGAAISAPMSLPGQIGEKINYDRQRDYLDAMGVDFYNDPEIWRKRQAPEQYLEQWR